MAGCWRCQLIAYLAAWSKPDNGCGQVKLLWEGQQCCISVQPAPSSPSLPPYPEVGKEETTACKFITGQVGGYYFSEKGVAVCLCYVFYGSIFVRKCRPGLCDYPYHFRNTAEKERERERRNGSQLVFWVTAWTTLDGKRSLGGRRWTDSKSSAEVP